MSHLALPIRVQGGFGAHPMRACMPGRISHVPSDASSLAGLRCSDFESETERTMTAGKCASSDDGIAGYSACWSATPTFRSKAPSVSLLQDLRKEPGGNVIREIPQCRDPEADASDSKRLCLALLHASLQHGWVCGPKHCRNAATRSGSDPGSDPLWSRNSPDLKGRRYVALLDSRRCITTAGGP